MWSQLIAIQVQPDKDIDAVISAIKAAELPDSGLISETFMRDQNDPSRFYIVPLFRSEEEARAREADPRRVEATATIQALLRDILAGPPQFTDLDVLEHWTV
jgi:quinol monooxygenase YgiN